MLHIGLGGHIHPAIRLGRVLVARGHAVLAFAPAPYRAQIEATGARFVSHDPLGGVWAAGLLPAFRAGLPAFAAALAMATERCAEELIEDLLSDEVELIVHDTHAVWGRVVGDFLGLPRIVSNPLFPGLDAAHPRLSSLLGLVGRYREPREPSPRSNIALLRSRAGVQRRWGVDLGDWVATLVNTAAHTVSYSTEAITGRPPPEGWCYAGPLMRPRRPAARSESVPLVYVAFGTALKEFTALFCLAIEALADQPFEVIVATGGGSPSRLGPLPSNVTVRAFVDQPAVLSRTRVHLTHGGAGSVHESLLAGVPMVCLPVGSDQFHWAEQIERLGAGEQVEPNVAVIRGAVLRLLEDSPARARARALGRQLARHDGAGRVQRLIDDVLGREARLAAGAIPDSAQRP
jgi:MGT family glycosyltransferase